MRVVIRDLESGQYYLSPGCWVGDAEQALDFEKVDRAEAFFFREGREHEGARWEVLFVGATASAGLKLPIENSKWV